MKRVKLLSIMLLLRSLTLFAGSSLNDELIKAASKGETDAVSHLLELGADVDAKNKLTDWTALTAAAYYGFPEIVKILIAAGADVNTRDFHGGTPLMKAVTMGPYKDRIDYMSRKAEVTKSLLRAGADATAKDNFAVVVWQMPIVDGNEELVQVFEDAGIKGVREERLIGAIDQGKTEAAIALIRKGVDLNAKNEDGVTAWTEAVTAGNSELIDLMLRSGADVNARMEDDLTPLMIATAKGDPDQVKKLLKAGADFRIKNAHGATALSIAIDSQKNEIVEILKRAGAEK